MSMQVVVEIVLILAVAGVTIFAFRSHDLALAESLGASLAAALGRVMATPVPLGGTQGGGAMPTRVDVYPWRTWPVLTPQCQLIQSLPSGAETSTWYNDCGETCCSIVIRACRGVMVPPDVLRNTLLGSASSGLTSAADLVAILASAHVQSHSDSVPQDKVRQELTDSTQDGRPVIALGRWPTPGGVLHWLLVLYVDSQDVVHYINPWGGVRSYLSVADWLTYSTGEYVFVDSHMLFG